MGSSVAELCTQERQILGNVLARRSSPSPSIGSISNFLDCLRLPAALRIGLAQKHAWVVEVSHLLCWHPHPVAKGSSMEHTFPTPPPNLTSQHQIIMQDQLKFWRAAGQDSSKFGDIPFSCHKGAKWCQNGQWRARRAPTLHFLAQPDCLHV